MKNAYDDLKKSQFGFGYFIKGFVKLLIEPLLDICKILKKEIIDKNKKPILEYLKNLLYSFLPLLFITFFVFYGYYGFYKDGTKIWNKLFNSNRYRKIEILDYEQEINEFFKKYEERFAAHDCGFMREVGADEGMYDKNGSTSYGEDYNCSSFNKIQRVKMLPINIGKIENFGDKLKIRGELIRIEITDGKPLQISPIKFELWKTIDMKLWHFNIYGDDRWIESEFKR